MGLVLAVSVYFQSLKNHSFPDSVEIVSENSVSSYHPDIHPYIRILYSDNQEYKKQDFYSNIMAQKYNNKYSKEIP